MKNVRMVVVGIVVILMSMPSVMGQMAKKMDTKVIAVINRADWCPVCQANGKRAMAEFDMYKKDPSIKFVVNDVTNDNTKMKSAETLQKYGLEKEMEGKKATGVVYFFNAETKELISQISVSKSDKELSSAIDMAKGKS